MNTDCSTPSEVQPLFPFTTTVVDLGDYTEEDTDWIVYGTVYPNGHSVHVITIDTYEKFHCIYESWNCNEYFATDQFAD